MTRSAEDLVWELVNGYGPARGVSPVVTFTLHKDMSVTAAVDHAGPLLQHFVMVVARPIGEQTEIELHGYTGDGFGGVVVPVGVMGPGERTLRVALEDLAPSLREDAA